MGSELETRRSDKSYLFQILKAEHESKTPRDFRDLIGWVKAKMEPEDVKLVLQEFDVWKNS